MSSIRFPIRVAFPGAVIVPQSERGEKPAVPLAKPLTLIGSGSGVHVCLQTRTVEEFHACIVNCDGRVLLRDLGSLAGVMVNEHRVRDAILRDGDQVRIGKQEFRFLFGGTAGESRTQQRPFLPAELRFVSKVASLESPLVLIGRGPRCDLRIDDDEASERHAIVYFADGHWHVRILTPLPGTMLNERSVRRASLQDGDQLVLARTPMTFGVRQDVVPGGTEPPRSQEPSETPSRLQPSPVDTGSRAPGSMIEGWGPIAAALAAADAAEPGAPQEPAVTAPSSRRLRTILIGAILLLVSSVAIVLWLVM